MNNFIVDYSVLNNLLLVILMFIIIYIHFYMHIRSREEIPYKEITMEDYWVSFFGPIRYIVFTIKNPSKLRIFVIVTYFFLISFFILFGLLTETFEF